MLPRWRGFRPIMGAVFPAVTVLIVGVSSAGAGFADTTIDKSRMKETPEGWEISIAKTEENLDRWPPLNAAAFSREAFFSATVSASIDGHGRTPVRSGIISMGLMIGCNTDVSPGLTMGMTGTLGANLGALGTGTVTQYPAGTAGLNGGVNAGVSPMVQVTLRPGTITTVALAAKSMAASTADLAVEGVALHVDSCMGQVAMRSIATLTISTATRDNSVTVYGEPVSF
ncbi:MspA family porin [Nocardia sp. CDC160]|uniref:MspA family porin n=1 Tax=Nocardia sp. CDC160 TaxID=3112166 RepID=UPI002DB66F4B|nr:MspA family porin [Nocardia sp. CDC160]MEC3916236.1 MspA family porin [Nocardia sp. CDC160]